MKKAVLTFLFAFLVFGMVFNFPAVLADEGSNSGSLDSAVATDNSGSDDLEDETTSEDEIEVEDETEDEDRVANKADRERLKEIAKKRMEERREKMRENLKKEFREDGKRVKIEREVTTDEDGNIVIKIKRTFVDADGNILREVKIEITEKDGKRIIKMESEENVNGENNDIETDLEIGDNFDGNESDLEATTSDGERHKIKVLPDEARRKILARLKANNISLVELREIKEGNIPRVIYNVKTNKHGRFFGVFKLAMKVDGQVDPETGEILDVSKPWWAILVIGEDDADEGFVESETETIDTATETEVVEDVSVSN